MDHGVAKHRIDQHDFIAGEKDLLGKDLDKTASKPLVADSTYAILGDYHSAIPSSVAVCQAISETQLGLLAERKRVPHASHDTSFIYDRIG